MSQFLRRAEFERDTRTNSAPKKRYLVLSDGTVFGAVQVPASGKPIVLLADRQTSGGYAKIAAVITADLPRLVQKRMDQKIRFSEITVEQAQELLLQEARELDRLRRRIHNPLRRLFGGNPSGF